MIMSPVMREWCTPNAINKADKHTDGVYKNITAYIFLYESFWVSAAVMQAQSLIVHAGVEA